MINLVQGLIAIRISIIDFIFAKNYFINNFFLIIVASILILLMICINYLSKFMALFKVYSLIILTMFH